MLERLRSRVEEYLRQRAHESYQVSLSVLRESRMQGLHAESERLFGLEQISAVQRELAGAAGREEKQLRSLLALLVQGRAAHVAGPELDQRLTWESYGSVVVDERTLAVREVPHELAREPDPARRRRIAESYHRALAEHEELSGALLGHWQEVIEELGYGAYVETWQLLLDIDLRALAREGERMIEASDAPFRELLAWFLPRLAGVELPAAAAADLERVREAQPYDHRFAPETFPGAIFRTLAETGLDPRAQGRLRIDVQPTLNAAGGARLQPVQVPDEVVLAVRPGGARFHRTVLQALGFGLHLAYTDAALPVELRWLGDRSTSLGYGALLRGLHGNPEWLARVHAAPRPELPELCRLHALLELLRARSAAAQLGFELAVHDEGPGRARELYAEHFERALLVAHDPREALWRVGLHFGSARRLRGDQLGALLTGHLRERCDTDWFRNPRAGPLLAELLTSGRTYTASEVAVQLASEPLGFGPLLDRTAEAME